MEDDCRLGRGEFDRHQGWRITTGRGRVNFTTRRGVEHVHGVGRGEDWPLGGMGAGCEHAFSLKQVLRSENVVCTIF